MNGQWVAVMREEDPADSFSWSAGQALGLAGEPVSACPLKPSLPEAKQWLDGWRAGTSERKRLAGEYGATHADKAAAGLPETASVPGRGWADDIDLAFVEAGCPAAGGLIRIPMSGTYRLDVTWPSGLGWSGLAGLSIDLTSLLDPATVDAVAQAFGVPMSLIADVPDEQPSPKARALARKRKSFVCHRHGQQPGGFCRTCQRRR